MKTPEWELSALIAADPGTEITVAGQVWRKVLIRREPCWVCESLEMSFSLGLMRRIREARAADLEG